MLNLDIQFGIYLKQSLKRNTVFQFKKKKERIILKILITIDCLETIIIDKI